ncbi:hypothetical protein HON01_03150, partial [Candidatus Woesearchaeota archaeon]|nr:hypothetical protein [Candidatus Woesearchaeota archaeon]
WLTLFEREKEVYVDVLKRMYAIFERKNPEPEKIIPELERMLQFQGGNIAAIKPDVSEYKLPDVLKLEEDLDSVIERVVDDFEKYIKGVEQDIVVKCQQNNKKKGSWVIRTNCPKEEKHFRTGSCGKITRHTSYDQPVIFENVTGIPIKLPQEKTVYDQQLSSALRISEEYGDARIAAENIVRLCAQKATEKVKDQNLANTQGTIKKFHPYLFEECLHAERMCDLLKLRMCKIYKADPKEYGVSETMLPKPIRRDRENKTDKNKTDENKVDDKTEKMVKDDGKLKQ